MNREHLATDLETLFVEIITEERILRLNRAIEKVYGGKVAGGQILDEEGKVIYSSLE